MRIWRVAQFLLATVSLGVVAAEDLVDTRQLGTRGAILETALGNEYGKIWDARSVGDFNGDGLDDLGVIYWSEPGALGHPWRIGVIYGRRGLSGRFTLDDLPQKLIFQVSSPLVRPGLDRPNHLHPVGDVNGDGLADFMVGISPYRLSSDQKNFGAGFLVYGHPNLEGEGFVEEIGDTVPGVVFWSSDPTHDSICFNFASIGDVNGDGRDDLAIGAVSSLVNGKKAGVLFVLLDTRSLPPRVDLADVGTKLPGFVIRGTVFVDSPQGTVERALGGFGEGIARIGDFDGDGIADFLVSGREIFTLYLVRGRTSWPSVIDLDGVDADGLRRLGVTAFRGPFDNRIFPEDHQFDGIGDLDGDGRSEILVGLSRGDPQFGQGFLADSEVFLFWGSDDLPGLIDLGDVPTGRATVFRPFHFGDFLGDSVAPAGDLDGDAVPDFLVGAPLAWRDGLTDVGEAYAVFSRAGWSADMQLDQGFDGIRILGEGLAQHFGNIVSSAGDFNGDGALDIAVAAPSLWPPQFGQDRGRIYIIYGSGSARPPLTMLGITPDFGTVRGGTAVVVRGSGFAGAVSMSFGGQAALQVEVVSSSELHAVSPPGAALGLVDITVTANGETRRLPGGFEYAEPLPAVNVAEPGRRGFTLLGDGERRVGESMALGDIMGDGAAELVVSLHSDALDGTWRVGIVHGGRRLAGTIDLSNPSNGVTLIDASATGNGGFVGIAGDANGDGILDLGLGADHAHGVILFGRLELPPAIDLAAELASGRAVNLVVPAAAGSFDFAPAGDVDGDGIADFAIGHSDAGLPAGAPRGGNGQVIILAGRRSWPAEVDLSRSDAVLGRFLGTAPQELGFRLAPAGDVNGDGRPDLLTSTATPVEGVPRRAYLIFGPASPPGEVAIDDYIAAGGGVAFDIDGTRNPLDDRPWVAGAGDVDGDGLADVLLGLWEAGQDFEGRTYLVRGSRELPPAVKLPGFVGSVEFIGPGSEAQSGPVGPAGDFNADGLADFLIASPGPVDPPGGVYLVLGSRELPPTLELAKIRARGLRIEGIVPFGGTQVPVREAGDLDGDGASDIAFSERGIGSPQDILGRVYVVFGLPKEAAFVRGDANFDDAVNISDAIFTLAFLFLGGPAPLCDDAADADDNGRLDITDAIRILNSLFLGTQTLPPPFPEEGQDLTPDSLGCLGF